MSLTMNRLGYTKHCFATLRANAGCDFDHYIRDQGSTDGTAEWLWETFGYTRVCKANRNVGIHVGMNVLLEHLERVNSKPYDVVVKVDNDCEVITPGTLDAVARLHLAHPDTQIGPTVQGLRAPMTQGAKTFLDGYWVAQVPMIGGIMQPIPRGHRYDESQPVWGMDDVALSQKARWCGQLVDYPVNHYRTTDQQWIDYPDYFAEKVEGGCPS